VACRSLGPSAIVSSAFLLADWPPLASDRRQGSIVMSKHIWRGEARQLGTEEPQTMYPNVLLFIDGARTQAAGGRTLPVANPASGDTIDAVARAERADLDRSLEAADKDFRDWRKVPALERSKVMRKVANLPRDRVDAIAPLLTIEQGKPLPEAKGEVLAGADVIDWFAEEARLTCGRVIPARAEGIYQLVMKEPVGPLAAFTPWNFPINQVVRKLSCALAAGCSIIVKAPEETLASRAELIRRFADAGVPAGVMNLVYGVPSEISEYKIRSSARFSSPAPPQWASSLPPSLVRT
jgi:succinate-semialdehyde dehydrogenase / glutarate-semialdehyde dehydrogenase